MTYTKIDITIKNPSKKLEERIREAGHQKYERMQKTIRDWRNGMFKNAEIVLVK